jgi:hypothetical protein
MSVVVERGLARCPYCVAVTRYVFLENESNSLCYEVDCERCGQRYREHSSPVDWATSAAPRIDIVPPPPAGPTPLRQLRNRAHELGAVLMRRTADLVRAWA